jgi:hypothetical protein
MGVVLGARLVLAALLGRELRHWLTCQSPRAVSSLPSPRAPLPDGARSRPFYRACIVGAATESYQSP